MGIQMNIPEWLLIVASIILALYAMLILIGLLLAITKRIEMRRNKKEIHHFAKTFFDDIEKDIQDHEPQEKKSFEKRINDLIEEKRNKK